MTRVLALVAATSFAAGFLLRANGSLLLAAIFIVAAAVSVLAAQPRAGER